MFPGKQWLLMKSWRHQQYLQSGRQTPAPTHASGLSRHWDLQSTTQKNKLDELWAFMYDKWTAHVRIFVALKAKAFGSENGARIFQHEDTLFLRLHKLYFRSAERNELAVKKKVHASPLRFVCGNPRFLHFARG